VGKNGFVQVPDGPGLGFDLNEQAVKEMLQRNRQEPEKLYFPPTEQWDKERSHDRQWSRRLPTNTETKLTAKLL